jgi:alpha-mannosidase
MPQIAAGFGMAAASVWRGVGAAPTEFRWASPDGTECLMLHLRESYSNGAWLGTDIDAFARNLASARDALAAHAPTDNLLIMNGTDHMAPREDLAACLREAEARIGDRIVHSTLPDYLAAVQKDLGPNGLAALPLVEGEMRSPERAHLLPAVLSARMWIKQWNARCENLLVRWAEPFSALSEQVCGTSAHRGFLRESWSSLLQNHPHDSICGCSIDQVHDEMRVRFAWSEQIAEQTVEASLASLAARIDTRLSGLASTSPYHIVVFNPTPGVRSGRVRARLPSAPAGSWLVVDGSGRPVPHRVLAGEVREFYNERISREQFLAILTRLAASQGTQLGRLAFSQVEARVEDGVGVLDVVVILGESAAGPVVDLGELALRIQALVEDESIESFQLHVVEEAGLDIELLARDVPGLGYTQLAVAAGSAAPAPQSPAQPQVQGSTGATFIENEYFRVEADSPTGTVTVTDRVRGRVFSGLNQFVDGGDRGDEYNFCAPEKDIIVGAPCCPPLIRCTGDGIGETLEIGLLLRVPRSLAEGDRSARSPELVDLPITTRASLTPGVHRIDFATTLDNQARDHRLRVLFPTPFATDRAWAEGHFDVIERPAPDAGWKEDWAEQPVGTQPQQTFVDVTDGNEGLLLANDGLPEVELLPGATGTGATLALTLLRCVGWLSRGDLPNRVGPAGPALATPGAQCLGQHTFRYALVPHSGNYLTAQREAHAFNAPLRSACIVPGARDLTAREEDDALAPSGSFVQVSPAAVVLTAIKPPEQGTGLVVRIYNSARTAVVAQIRFWRAFGEITHITMDESAALAHLAQNSADVTLRLRAKEIATLRIMP